MITAHTLASSSGAADCVFGRWAAVLLPAQRASAHPDGGCGASTTRSAILHAFAPLASLSTVLRGA